jgi:FKBP-type peptidyl-prolyl cis-trans isomerase
MTAARTLGTALAVLLLTAQGGAGETPAPGTRTEKESYSAGFDVGRSVRRQMTDIDRDLFMKGVKDGLSGETPLLSNDEIEKTLSLFRIELRAKRQEWRKNQTQAHKAAAANNRKAGEAFLAGNAGKEGVVTLPSGLQYRILEAGNGRKPTDADTVELRYLGTLVDGTGFDRSDPGGSPAAMKVAAAIPGWREALKLMPAGSKWQLFIPPRIAYGSQGDGRRVGPEATLLIEVELLAVR